MTTYASLAQQILDAQLRQVDWVKERIRESDELRDQLEEINLREANEGTMGKHQVPALLRLGVEDLVEQMNLDKRVPYYPIPLLELVFELQEALFARAVTGDYWEPEEDSW